MIEKIYGRFVIDFFDDGDAVGIKDYAHPHPGICILRILQ